MAKKTILFIAPSPPPFTGQSIISEELKKHLSKNYKIIPLNYTRNDLSFTSGFKIDQIINVLKLGKIIKKNKKKIDIVYLTISQSSAGNLKDLYFLFKAGSALRKKTVIHLHGGFFENFYKKSLFIIKRLNRMMFKNIKAAVVLSPSLVNCLTPVINKEKILTINNYAEDNLFITDKQFSVKWKKPAKLKILFLSNMLKGKGYGDLLDAFINLPDNIKRKYELYFAGNFDNGINKKTFLDKIKKYKNIFYKAFVSGKEKNMLIKSSHLFILPTIFYEGQPVSIIESYAAGLAVFTTDRGGIKDIFTEGFNGELIGENSSALIKKILINAVSDINKIKKYASNNKKYSLKFTKKTFISKITKLFEI